jgi:hypothetical protein
MGAIYICILYFPNVLIKFIGPNFNERLLKINVWVQEMGHNQLN